MPEDQFDWNLIVASTMGYMCLYSESLRILTANFVFGVKEGQRFELSSKTD